MAIRPSTVHRSQRHLDHYSPLDEHGYPIQSVGPLGLYEVIVGEKHDEEIAADITCQDLMSDAIAFLQKSSGTGAQPTDLKEGSAKFYRGADLLAVSFKRPCLNAQIVLAMIQKQ